MVERNRLAREKALARIVVKPLNRQAIETLVTRARTVKGKQFELADDRVAGLRIRAGERLRSGDDAQLKMALLA